MQIGLYNNLSVLGKNAEGLVLSDGTDTALLPFHQVKEDIAIGESLFVFVYHNKEGKLVATLDRPLACVGDFAYLKVVGENEKGVFLDIGIDKDIFVPKREQRRPMHSGESYVVHVFRDEMDERIVASSYLEEFVEIEPEELEEGEEVSLLVAESSELGFTCIINNKYIGLLYRNEVYEDVELGESRVGFIRKIRENKKIDLSLRPIGFDFILESRDTLLDILKANGGVLKLGDKSAPEDIRHHLKMSKKAFKQAVGGLYKQRLITIADYEIRLNEDKTEEEQGD
ncbi:CvfB family protein [Desertivirga arenae]|uniref:CvfB family protein n=1 Tax=Desertivirga arenae TaxID=2810309 RepID=UPI001A97923C|nr:S1-like domain-containing RNA-binding protein [Pedobacter sp. SYSU D00823]